VLIEFIKFLIYSGIIVIISKYVLVTTLRKLAETLNLKPKTVGDIAGYATSMPELLTIGTSSFSGLISASIVNVISSNVINLIQYVSSIFLNKNQKVLKNRAIKIDLILVAITIIIPIILFAFNIEINIGIVPIFIGLCVLFVYLNSNVHKLYLKNEDEKLEKEIEEEEKWQKNNKKKTVKYIFYLLCSGVLLFVVGELLGNTLENLCNQFNISQTIIGILLGFITSIPELITFFEAQKHYKKKTEDAILGVVEATNNLFTSNILNLFVIQSIGIIIYSILA
jgi:Ca2+/Na+ antiporter